MKRFVTQLFAPDENGGGSGGSGGGESGGGSSNTGGNSGGNGSGGSENTPAKGGDSSSSQEGNSNGNGDQNKAGSGNGDNKRVEFTVDQQKHIYQITAAARKQGREAAAREAEQNRLKEEGKFKELHEAQEKRIKEELEPKAELADKLSGYINQLIDDETKEWAPELRKQDPGSENVGSRFDWVLRSRDLAKALKGTRQAPNGEHGVGSGGAPTGGPVDYTSTLKNRYAVPGGGNSDRNNRK